MKKRLAGLVLAFCMVLTGGGGASAETTYNWIEGGKKVDLKSMAEVDLSKDFVFLNAADTIKMKKENHETPTGNELGSIFPVDEKQTWAVIFRYEETGHIKDAEKEKIDAKAILKSYKEGTEEANKERQAGERIYVKGWDIEPFYDVKTHNLTWSLLAEDDNKEELLNYNVRLLTRKGTISAVLVSDPQHREEDKKILNEQILPKLAIKTGERYEDFDATKDKVAEYGLTGLILGGAGLAVAKKVGLIGVLLVLVKKFWFVALIAIGAIGSLVKRLFRRKPAEPVQNDAEKQGESSSQ